MKAAGGFADSSATGRRGHGPDGRPEVLDHECTPNIALSVCTKYPDVQISCRVEERRVAAGVERTRLARRQVLDRQGVLPGRTPQRHPQVGAGLQEPDLVRYRVLAALVGHQELRELPGFRPPGVDQAAT